MVGVPQICEISGCFEVGLELQEQENMVIEPWNNQSGSQNGQELVQQSDDGTHVSSYNQNNSDIGTSYPHHQVEMQNGHHQVEMQNGHHQESFDRSLNVSSYDPTSDAINMFPVPSCSPSTDLLPNPPISFANLYTSLMDPVAVYDPLLPLNLPIQPPMMRGLFQSLPHGYYNNLGGCSKIDNDGVGRPFTEGVFEFTSVYDIDGRKDTKKFASEKQRRVHLNDKFEALKNLVPNPTKPDKASIVGDAIGYIKELKRTVNELKILVEKKRSSRERMKRRKTEDDSEIITLVKTEDFDNQTSSGLRTSWLHRKSKDTEVDVRIIDDEVTVKLVQQKKVNCLLFVSKVFDELQLDFNHVAGGLIGDYYSFFFNSKIHEGSTVYAHAIANKLIGAGDKQ